MNKTRKLVKPRKEMQLRAEEIKSLLEQRADAVEEMKTLAETIETEQRAFSEEEDAKFDELEKRVQQLDATIEKIEKAKSIKLTEKRSEPDNKEAAEERAFEAYLRGTLNQRADDNLTFEENGAVIPTTIAQKIIKKVQDICPVYEKATKYNVKGTLTIPYYDETDGGIKMAFADEFTELESTSGKYANITLNGFLAGALTKISKSLMGNSQFDIVGEVITNMAQEIARFIEKTLLNGAEGKVEGLSNIKNVKIALESDAVTMDELIELKDTIKDIYQSGCVWIMSTATRTALRKLKDGNERYLMQDDVTSPFGTTLLGKPVYVSDNMPDMATGNRAIIYGDLSGLAVKLSENANVQVLHEKYATEHAVGVVAWMEFDAKIENEQKLAALKMA